MLSTNKCFSLDTLLYLRRPSMKDTWFLRSLLKGLDLLTGIRMTTLQIIGATCTRVCAIAPNDLGKEWQGMVLLLACCD